MKKGMQRTQPRSVAGRLDLVARFADVAPDHEGNNNSHCGRADAGHVGHHIGDCGGDCGVHFGSALDLVDRPPDRCLNRDQCHRA